MYLKIYVEFFVVNIGPDGSFVSTRAFNLEVLLYQVPIMVVPDICHRGCAYAVLQTVQRNKVNSAAMALCTIKNLWSHAK